MSERRTVKTVLQYEVDKNSTRQAVESADAVERAVNGITSDFTRLGPVAKASVTGIRLGFNGLQKDAKALDTQLARVEDSFEGVERAARRAGSAGGPGGFRTSTESVGDLGSLLSATAGLDTLGGGTLSRALGEFGQLGDVVEALGRLPSAIDDVSEAIGVGKTGLIGGLGAVAIVAGVATIAFAAISEQMAESARRAEEYQSKIAAIGDVFAQGQGSAGVQGLIDDATQRQASIDFQRTFAQGLIDQVLTEFPDSGEGGLVNNGPLSIQRNERIRELTGGQVQSLSVLEDGLASLGEQSDAVTAELYLYNQQLQSTPVLLQDAALEQERINNFISESVARRSAIEADTVRFLETATSDSADARIQAAQDEIDRLRRVNDTLRAVGGETAEALIAQNEMRIEEQLAIRETTQALRGAADERSAFNRVFGFFSDAVGGGIDSFTTGIDSVRTNFERLQPAFETIAKITEEQVQSAARLSEIARQQSDAEAKALYERDRELGDTVLERQTALEDLEREHKDRLIDINRRANATIANSIGERDALAAFLAQENRRDELSQERRNNREAIRRIEANFKEQQRVIQRRYDEQLAAARSAAERAAEIERARLQLQVDALNVQLANQQAASNAYLTIQDGTNAVILQGAINLQAQIATLWGQWNADAAARAEAAYQEYLAAQAAAREEIGTGRAYGGMVNSGSRVLVGEKGPEVVYFRSPGMVVNNRTARSMGGGDMPITLNMVGRSDAQIAQLAGREVENYVSRLLKASRQRRGQ